MKKLLLATSLSMLLTATCSAEEKFHHPGAFDSAAEFQQRAQGLKQAAQPWLADFKKLRSNAHDNPNIKAHPVPNLVRGTAPNHPPENYAALFNDAASAYALALDWRLSGDAKRGAAAARILNAWSHTLKSINGTSDKYLASGLYGYQLAVAGETLRDFKGWSQADQQALKNSLLTIFAPMNQDFLEHHNHSDPVVYWANWDLANIASLVAIGIFTDNAKLYQEGVDYYLHGVGNGAIEHAAWMTYPGGLAQWQESGRDQAHSMLGIGLAGAICQMAWEQGDDLFAADNNRLLAAARYVAKYNLGQSVPYTPYRNAYAFQPEISAKGRGQARPIWALIYGHYVQIKHLPAPEIQAIMNSDGIEGGGGDYGPNSGGFDALGYGTLTFLNSEP